MQQSFAGLFSKCRSTHTLNSVHKSCKLQNNWFKCDGQGRCQKIHTPPSVKGCFPLWRACDVQRQFLDWEWRTIESHCWHEDHCSRLLLHCCLLTKAQSSMLLRAIADISDTLFSELYVIWIFSFYFSQLIVKVRPDKHCILAFCY